MGSKSRKRLNDYAKKVAEENETLEADKDELEGYATRLTKSLHSLQSQVKQHSTALEKLRAKGSSSLYDEPSEVPRQRLQQVQAIKATYLSLFLKEPNLPSPESPLPALLALRATLNLIDQSKQTIGENSVKLTKAHADASRERQSLDDGHYLSSTLENRIQRLRQERAEISKQSKQEVGAGRVAEQQRRKLIYRERLRSMVRAFNAFVNDHLAIMLAAEDLGGPVVGDVLSLDERALKAGFTQQGRAKKADTADDRAEDKRIRRNLEIWGASKDCSNGEARSEKEAAASSFRALTERLLNAAADADNPDSYISIDRETAAVRFLVRAKVARFHARDARKLALVNSDSATEI